MAQKSESGSKSLLSAGRERHCLILYSPEVASYDTPSNPTASYFPSLKLKPLIALRKIFFKVFFWRGASAEYQEDHKEKNNFCFHKGVFWEKTKFRIGLTYYFLSEEFEVYINPKLFEQQRMVYEIN